MPRSSRHKSHRAHKHSSRDARDRSDSEEELSSRERKQRGEETAAGSGSRVSRATEPEKRKSSSLSHPSQEKDMIITSNDDFSAEHGKKRKEREDSAVADRWNGGGEDDLVVDKVPKGEGFETVDLDKTATSKLSSVDLKGRSSRRREGSSERNEESSAEVGSVKHRSEKDSRRRESSSSQYKDVKERDRERGPERDKKVQDSMHERSDDLFSKKEDCKMGSSEERVVKKDTYISDELRNPELEKELDKRIKRRRDGSGDNEKWLGDDRKSDDRRISSRDDHSKNESYTDERHKDGKYRDKYREDLDRDQRHRDDKHRDDRSSRVHTNDRSDNKHSRDDEKSSESRGKKSKIQDSDHDGSPYVDDHGTKLKDNRGRKRVSDENEYHSDMKPRSAKEPHQNAEKNGSSTSKFDSRTDSGRLERSHSDKGDSNLSNNRPKSSPSSSAYAVKDQSRNSSKQTESTCRESLSEDTCLPNTVSRGEHATSSGVRERASESRSLEKIKPMDDNRSDGLIAAEPAASHYDRNPRSDAHTSPNSLTKKSPSTSDRRSERTGARHILDMEEVGQRIGSSKKGRESSATKDRDTDRELPVEKPNVDDRSQVELFNSEPISVGSSSSTRTGHFSGSSPSHLPPPPPVRLGIDSPSVLGSYEDENRVHYGDRKSNSRYKRSADITMGRGQGPTWKGAPTWPSPVANGFISLQHGPPPAGFHPGVQQFPAPPLFGVRPSMDMSHSGVSYHTHETANRFSGHGRPYGWHSSLDDCPPHLQVWDGSNGVFGDESHVYGRPEWDQNRHLMGSRGWEMSADMWKRQSGNASMEFHVPQTEQDYPTHALADEPWVGQSESRQRDERARSECPPADISGIKRPNDIPLAKNTVGITPKDRHNKTPETFKMPSVHKTSEGHSDDNARFCCNYLSKIDISLDLAHPELYKQCISLLETKDGIGAGNVSKHGHLQNNKEHSRVATKSTTNVFSSIFSPVTDAIFQRAMSLYKKQNVRMEEVMPPALPFVCPEEKKNSPEVSDGVKLKAVSNQTSSEDPSPTNSHSANNMEEGNNTPTDAEGDHPGNTKEQQCDLPGDTKEQQCMEEGNNTPTDAEGDHSGNTKEQQCDHISDAVVFVEGSEACEALMPECRVNLSRIHLSPESTH